MTSDDSLAQQRVEIERLADAIERLTEMLARRQDTRTGAQHQDDSCLGPPGGIAFDRPTATWGMSGEMTFEQIIAIYRAVGALNEKQFEAFGSVYSELKDKHGDVDARLRMVKVFRVLPSRQFAIIAKAVERERYIGLPVPSAVRVLRAIVGGVVGALGVLAFYFFLFWLVTDLIGARRVRVPILGFIALPFLGVALGALCSWQFSVREMREQLRQWFNSRMN